MPLFECRFPLFDGDEPDWKPIVVDWDDARDAAEEFCKANFSSSLLEVRPPYLVEVRDCHGAIVSFGVDVEDRPHFYAYRV